jgi:hypothetical protein
MRGGCAFVIAVAIACALVACPPSNADCVSYATERVKGLKSATGQCPGPKDHPGPDDTHCPYMKDPIVLDSHVEPCCAGAGVQVWLTMKDGAGTSQCMVQVMPNGSELNDNGVWCRPDDAIPSK